MSTHYRPADQLAFIFNFVVYSLLTYLTPLMQWYVDATTFTITNATVNLRFVSLSGFDTQYGVVLSMLYVSIMDPGVKIFT